MIKKHSREKSPIVDKEIAFVIKIPVDLKLTASCCSYHYEI